ncbi:hypothetical protein FB446DRAFT_11182 [Lentinula raphanica]|nr:hypothetical protein FB446DRAFT_11182 [Lentinula raphanica]
MLVSWLYLPFFTLRFLTYPCFLRCPIPIYTNTLPLASLDSVPSPFLSCRLSTSFVFQPPGSVKAMLFDTHKVHTTHL